MSEMSDLKVEQIANIVFRKKEKVDGPRRNMLDKAEKDLKASRVYDRMDDIWKQFCDNYHELDGQKYRIRTATSLTLKNDGDWNNGDKRFFLKALIKHFKLAKRHQKSKGAPAT